MSTLESSDCYLCGARNDLHADVCVRCDGQLLRLPTENLDLATADAVETIIDELPEETFEPSSTSRIERARRALTSSVEDQRLSAALGLKSDVVDPEFLEPVVTSIPRATQSASIPILGTRPGMVSQSSLHSKEFGVRTFVLLASLLVATAWLGWVTLNENGSEEATPDNLAFTDSTLPPTTTSTTTEAPRHQWSEAEVLGTYGHAFTRIQLLDCPSTTEDGKTTGIEPADDVWTSGIAINEHSVIFSASEFPSAFAAIIRTRSGQRHLALLHTEATGTRVATTPSTMSRHLDVTSVVEGEPEFSLIYNEETNAVSIESTESTSSTTLTVTNLGEVDAIRVGRQLLQPDGLAAMDFEVEPMEIDDAPVPTTTCDRAGQLHHIGTNIPQPSVTQAPNPDTISPEETEAE